MLIAACALAGLSAFPAHAQLGMQAQLELDGRSFALSPKEAKSLTELRNSITEAPLAQDVALKSARRAAESRDARYLFAVYALAIGNHRGDQGLRAEALDILIAAGTAPKIKLASWLDARGGIAFEARDFALARTMWTRLLEMRPGDADVLANLAQVQAAEADTKGAGDLLERAAAARAASGQKAPELWYRQRLSLAGQAAKAPEATAAALALVSAYPTPRNWHDALIVYRQSVAPKDDFEIDLLRLTRTVGALSKADEYQRLAQLLEHRGMAAEAKAVLTEGVARGLLAPGESPTREIIAEVDRALPREAGRLQGRADPSAAAESLFGAARYPESASLYRAALQLPSADPAELNARLGMALAAAGRPVEAEAAFRAAASAAGRSPQPLYADLASFWLAWLQARSGAG